jgi:hypothetical protein
MLDDSIIRILRNGSNVLVISMELKNTNVNLTKLGFSENRYHAVRGADDLFLLEQLKNDKVNYLITSDTKMIKEGITNSLNTYDLIKGYVYEVTIYQINIADSCNLDSNVRLISQEKDYFFYTFDIEDKSEFERNLQSKIKLIDNHGNINTQPRTLDDLIDNDEWRRPNNKGRRRSSSYGSQPKKGNPLNWRNRNRDKKT